MLEQVSFVRLIPTNLPGGNGADVEPVDIARSVQLGREILVARDRGGDQRGAPLILQLPCAYSAVL